MDFKRISNNEEQSLINFIHIQEGLVVQLSNITERLESKYLNLLILTTVLVIT
jgi:hypothetical protein